METQQHSEIHTLICSLDNNHTSRRRSGNTGRKDNMEYKDYYIDDSMYGLITVQYCGDDVVFRSVEEAKKFIDEITEV